MAATNASESKSARGYHDSLRNTDYRSGAYQKVEQNSYKPKEYNRRSGDNDRKPADQNTMYRRDSDKSGEANPGYQSNMPKKQEYKSKESSYNRENNDKKENHYSRNNNYNRDNNFSRQSNDKKENYYNKQNNQTRELNPNSGSNRLRSENNDIKRQDSRQKPAGNITGRDRFNHFADYNRNYMVDKEEEEDYKAVKGHKQADTRGRSSQSKDSELLPDKLETMKRLEREKKMLLKKNHEEETEKPRRPQIKQKRAMKDWTKDYENDLLDEDEGYSGY